MMQIAGRSARGMTLVELMVALAVGGVVFGLLLGAMIETGRRTDRDVERHLMAAEAASLAQAIDRLLSGALAEGDASFERDVLTFQSCESLGSAAGLAKRIAVGQNEDGPTVVIESGSEAVYSSPNRDRIASQVQFRYAREFNGIEAVWNAAAGGTPRLVEYRVRVWPRRSGSEYEKAVDAQARPHRLELVGVAVWPQ